MRFYTDKTALSWALRYKEAVVNRTMSFSYRRTYFDIAAKKAIAILMPFMNIIHSDAFPLPKLSWARHYGDTELVTPFHAKKTK